MIPSMGEALEAEVRALESEFNRALDAQIFHDADGALYHALRRLIRRDRKKGRKYSVRVFKQVLAIVRERERVAVLNDRRPSEPPIRITAYHDPIQL